MNESEYTRRKIMPVIRDRGGWCVKKAAGRFNVTGMPDVHGCYRGRTLGLEVKKPGGSYGVTEKQQDTLDAMAAAGAEVAVVTLPEEVHAILDAIDREADGG